jgi:hypothetical protein
MRREKRTVECMQVLAHDRERERRSIACLVSVCMIGSPGWPRTAFLVGHRIADLGMAREAYIHII